MDCWSDTNKMMMMMMIIQKWCHSNIILSLGPYIFPKGLGVILIESKL